MSADGVLYDISEFIASPLRTGIQRVTFEILYHWPPGRAPLRPVLFGPPGRWYYLPPETPALMVEFFGRQPGDPAAARERLAALAARIPDGLAPADPERCLGLFNPELFYAADRIAAYETLLRETGARCFFFLHDFLPWLYPWWFGKGLMHQIPMMEFLRMVRQVRHVAFNSEATRRDYHRRIVRRDLPTGPVLTLGGDGLGRAEPAFAPPNRRFTVVGSLESRKNTGAVLQAFRSLWAAGVDARLTLVGKQFFLPEEDRRLLEETLRTEPRLEWLQNLSDDQVRAVIRDSRATLFMSEGEGFGIPPLESLSLGVPVIAFAGVPSLAAVEPHGQLRLARADRASIRQAVLDFLEDDFAARKHEQIRLLKLPTWADQSRNAAGWIEGVVRGQRAARAADTAPLRAAA
jgi:glycosyltransferase involved in cell wall biosynthesis